MTRIVAGQWGGRSIEVPAKGTRPTSDRVREAIFSRLEHLGVVNGAYVLDLYAGSGALGLEAASRGAGHITLVDSARVAVLAAGRNMRALGARGVVEQSRADRCSALNPARAWDLVFVDPPYDIGEDELAAVLAALARPGVVAATGMVVVERSRRSPEPGWPPGWTGAQRKDYGETVVYYQDCMPTIDVDQSNTGKSDKK